MTQLSTSIVRCGTCKKYHSSVVYRTCESCRKRNVIYCNNNKTALRKHRKKRYSAQRERIRKQNLLNNFSDKLQVLKYYSNDTLHCILCPESRFWALTIDHINGGGRKHRASLKVHNFYRWLINNNLPDGYRCLCYNCNTKQYLLQTNWQYTDSYLKKKQRDSVIKRAVLDMIGGVCKCGQSDIDVLTVHHINDDGAKHRRELTNGNGGIRFYRKIFRLNEYDGLECRCFSCNSEEHFRLVHEKCRKLWGK